jgi:hypothetical protein
MIKVKSVDEHGKRRRNVELEQQAGRQCAVRD